MSVFERIRTDRYALLSAIICALLFVLIFYSLYVRVRMYMLGISLWNDEAKFAESIVNRSFSEMLTPPLANKQTAPMLYLIVVKALTTAFGTSESILRVFSFISLILMLVAQGLLLRKVFQVRMIFTLFSVAVSSTFLYYMQYSHELKPYMGDATFVLFVLLGYYAYREGLLGHGIRSAVFLGLICSACMILSSPAAFTAGAVFIVEFIYVCFQKDRTKILLVALGGAVFLALFIMYYLYWLRPIATHGGMLWYWQDYRFEFIVTGRDTLIHNFHVLWNLLEPIRHVIVLTLPFAIAGFIISLAKRNIYTAAVGVFFILLLIASAIDKYPILSRLWMFLFVLIFIYVFIFINELRISINDGKAAKALQIFIPLILSAILLVPNMSFPAYGRGEEWTLVPGNQANPLISYVRENIREGESLYSYFSANYILRYKNGFDVYRIGDVENDNIIFGTRSIDDDINSIVETDGAYILFSHSYYPLSQDPGIKKMTDKLQAHGYVEQVMNVYHTFLYWFTDDLSRIRSSALFDIHDLYESGGSLSGVARVENTGTAILSPENPIDSLDADREWELYNNGSLYIVLFKTDGRIPSADITDGIILGEFTSPINPGEIAEVLIDRGGLEPGNYQIELVSYGAYSFSQLGTDPIKVVIR